MGGGGAEDAGAGAGPAAHDEKYAVGRYAAAEANQPAAWVRVRVRVRVGLGIGFEG